MKRGAHHVSLHCTLSLSEHRLGQNEAGMTDEHSSDHVSSLVLAKRVLGSYGSGDIRMNEPANMSMPPQGSFHIIPTPY